MYTVYLDGGDAYRIARTLKLPMEHFVELSRHDEGTIRLDDSASRYRLHLKKVADPDPRFPGRCPFLLSIGDRGRCGIYAIRPSVCGAYPTSFAGGLIGLGDGGEYCPPDSWHLESLDVPLFRLWPRKKRQGEVLHQLLIEAWNARVSRPQHPRRYFHYLFNAYQEVEVQAPKLLGEAPLDEPDRAQLQTIIEKVVAELS